MKKLVSFVLTVCMCLSIGTLLTACNEMPPEDTVSYTVTEDEWKVNFNLTKGQSQAQVQTLACAMEPVQVQLLSADASQPLTEITSYTLYAEGESEGTTGTALLKVAHNAMSIEFYVNGTLKEEETGTYKNDDVLYTTLTNNVMVYFPFANNYNDFTFDQTKNAYVSEKITSTMVDDYDPTQTSDVFTKSAEVTFVNGYLNTVTVELCDKTFTDVYAAFVFTFSNINNTTVSE